MWGPVCQDLLPHGPVFRRRNGAQGVVPGGGRELTWVQGLLEQGKALSEAVGPEEVVEGGLRRDGGHRRDGQTAEVFVRPRQQPARQPPAPGRRVGGHGIEVRRPEAALPGETN